MQFAWAELPDAELLKQRIDERDWGTEEMVSPRLALDRSSAFLGRSAVAHPSPQPEPRTMSHGTS